MERRIFPPPISWSEMDHRERRILAFEWIEHGLHCRHAARIDREPAGHHGGVPAALPDALEAVERISELLDLSGLFSALLLHPRRDRTYTGGIRVSGLDFRFPCPYGALESYEKRSRRLSL